MNRLNRRPVTLMLATLALFTVGQALFLSNSGCSGGAICYRVTDCPIGDRCVSGTCTHRVTVSSDGTTASSGTSAGGSAAGTATAGNGGAATMTGALTNAADAANLSEAGAASLSEAGAASLSEAGAASFSDAGTSGI
jgi:hypothetical protein